GRHILVVEDNELNQEVALGFLGEFGFTVELAADGAAAVSKVLASDPDYYAAVLMDMQMPVMDGLTATRAIRAAARYADLPIIAMTANAMAQDRERCLAAGMNDYVGKPIEPQALRGALIRWIGGDGADNRPSQIPDPSPEAALPAALPAIRGLDSAGGLRRMMGNATSYVALLHRFAEHHADADGEIAAALRAGDRDAAERLAHTLKGVAGNIGAAAVAAQAQRVETAIRAGADTHELDAALDRLGTVLAALVGELRGTLPQPPEAASGTVDRERVDRERAEEASRQLARLLADSDVAALAFLTNNSLTLRPTLGEYFREIESATAAFDFAAALEALNRAARDLEIAP
ncbi:MAG TPA: response regulator, partial [Stellaceae bacterium]|nr:response regulator [Stellaceae bacterium]